MCKYHNLLVEQSQARSVIQCEHDTVHLRWDHLTISLAATDDFRPLLALFQQALNRLGVGTLPLNQVVQQPIPFLTNNYLN